MTADPHYVRIAEGEPLPDVTALKPFGAAVVLADRYSQAWQNAVSDWLVESGCLYMSAWGPDCSSWDDSVDWAYLDRFPGGDGPEESMVYTDWHPSESLDEFFWFVGHGATHDVPLNKLIVDVCGTDRREEMLRRYAAAQIL